MEVIVKSPRAVTEMPPFAYSTLIFSISAWILLASLRICMACFIWSKIPIAFYPVFFRCFALKACNPYFRAL